jgi:hypothetical protein
VTGLGTVNFIPLWTSMSNIANSVLFQSATSPFKIGINTTTPATTLDVKGAGTIRGRAEDWSWTRRAIFMGRPRSISAKAPAVERSSR